MAPDVSKPKIDVYSTRYVAFLDILGFSNIVRESHGKHERATELVTILDRIASQLPAAAGENEGDDFKFQSFSDCVVMSENASTKGLSHLLQMVAALTLDLLDEGMMVRGGMAKGDLHHSDKVVLGPALLGAYRIESTIARYPRVVLDRSTHLDSNQSRENLAYASDGPVFVDFLATFAVERSDPQYDFMRTIAKNCHQSVERMLHESIYDPKHFEKLKWLATYWNDSLTKGDLERINLPFSKTDAGK
jgi:hypothetical protein